MKRYGLVIGVLIAATFMSLLTGCTTQKKSELNPAEYTAGKKVAEEYDSTKTDRKLKVFGAAHSDGNYGVIYGQCAVGTVVTAKSQYGEASVQSEGGSFALRIPSPMHVDTVEVEVTQSYNGEQIGESISWSGKKKRADYGDEWNVVIGLENQGFYRKMIPDFEQTNFLSEYVCDDAQKRYADRVENLKTVGEGCEMICVLVPSPMTVYPEQVPKELANQGGGTSKFDQISNMLEGAGAKVIDLRQTFAEHKDDEFPLYYNFDSHWTEYGAYLAYVELYDYISDKYPDAMPRKFDEFTWNWGYYSYGDMPYYFDVCHGGRVYEYTIKREMNFETDSQVSRISAQRYTRRDSLAYRAYSNDVVNGGSYDTGRENLPSIFVYRNSYGAQMFDLLLDRSNQATINPIFTYAYNFAQIKRAEPDYVIYIMTEWDFDNFINN